MEKNYKKIFSATSILIIICISSQPIISATCVDNKKCFDSIDYDSALAVAISKLKDLKKNSYKIQDSYEILDEENKVLCYVFDLDPSGYIVVTAYKILPPVLAYSFTSSFFKEDCVLYNLIKIDIKLRLNYFYEFSDESINENKKLWDYYLGLDDSFSEETTFLQWPKEGTTVSGGWIETKWHQNSPFNDFCPIDLASGDHCIAGCPAVAMAQILNYHQTTNFIQFNDSDDYYHSYGGNKYTIDDDYQTYNFPSFPQLNSYLDDLMFNYQNQQTISDENKAALVFACGVAAKQVYSLTVSGTFGVNQAYKAYQRFSFDDCKLIKTGSDMYDKIQDNIINGLPVHLAVVDETWSKGHNLIIDGYKTDGFYHLNFGWGGGYDGWYKLPPENIPYNLNVIEGVIVDIINTNSYSNLRANGVLHWPDSKAGSTVTGCFTIENVGPPSSEINWEIIVWPSWGVWTFEPSSGENLTPEYGFLTVNVSVVVPNKKNQFLNGYVKIVDVQDNKNSALVHTSLSTRKTRNLFSNFNFFFQKNHFFPFFRFLFTL